MMLTVAIVTVMFEIKKTNLQFFSYCAKSNSRSKHMPFIMWCEIPNTQYNINNVSASIFM
jgi:hypothetical protein